MPETLKVILVVAGLVCFVVGAIYAHKAAKKRREALAALAAELGFSFDPSMDASHDDMFGHFAVFSKGHSRRAFNTLEGSVEVDGRVLSVKMGDFRYKITTHNGKHSSTQTYTLSYLIVGLPFGAAPSLLIRREGFFDKVAGALGFDDIDFESAEFSRKFCVKSSDKRFAYDVVHPRMMEFLLNSTPPTVEVERQRLLVLRGERTWAVEDFRPQLEWAKRFIDLWPDHVTRALSA